MTIPIPEPQPRPREFLPRESGAHPPRVAIIGGGIAGLAAAWFLRESGLAVTVLEGSARTGGKLSVTEVAGVEVDEGAEALLARRPEGTGLIGELGLSGELRAPGTTSAGIWTRGEVRSLPRRQFMGVPADLGELAATGLLSPAGLARAGQDAGEPAGEPDISVAGLVGGRLGRELVDRIVDPLLGGVYAGRCDDLSFLATLPALAAALPRHGSLTEAAASLLPPPASGAGGPAAQGGAARPAPVFVTLAGGLGSLPARLAAASGARVRTRATVRELARADGHWRLTVGSAHAPESLDADAVILALPARPAGRLLAGVAGAADAAAALGEIEYASMAIVTLAYRAGAFPAEPAGSGFLVPAVDGHAIKAVTFSTVKWPHLRQGAGQAVAHEEAPHIVRCSVGRLGDVAILQREDGELARLAAADLTAATGAAGRPAAFRVTRWGGALPQYSVGHLDRVARIRAGVAAQPGLAVCGAAYDGVGIPACIASARQAAGQVIAQLAASAARDPS